MSLTVPMVEPTITEEGRTELVMVPRAIAADPVEQPTIIHDRGILSDDIIPRVIDTAKPLECVPFARAVSGIEIRGNANRWWQLAAGKYQRGRRPEEGAVLVMRGYNTNRRGHVAGVK